MRIAASLLVLLSCALAVRAELVTVDGQGVILPSPPANVFDQGPNDVPSATTPDGALAITAFDEKKGVVLSSPITISINPTITLQPGVSYDSYFIYFHQKSNLRVLVSAEANFTVDNRVIGCTQTIADEFKTTPLFGLTSAVSYPTNPALVSSARGYEPEDGVIGVGTVFSSRNTVTQPGDYTRCFSHSCRDVNGGPCACSAALSACLSPANDEYHCFSDPQALASLPEFSVSSTCVVDKSSAVISVKSCDSSKGCRRNGDAVCLRSSSSGAPSSVELSVTAGCSCAVDITATFTPQATGASCYVADTELGCKSGAKVLVFGQLTQRGVIDPQNKWATWLQTALPGSTVDTNSGAVAITSALLSGYDLLITALLPRIVSASESAAVASFVNNGGALIALAGFQNDQDDINRQQSVLADLGVSFVHDLTTFTPNPAIYNYNPANPLIDGLAGKWISYAGGWPSTPTATGVLFAQQAPSANAWNPNLKSVGQTIVLPSGGKIVAWGDEWATFLSEYSTANNGNAIFWKNAVSWVSNICVSAEPCDASKFTVGASCTSASHTSSGKGFTLSFSSAASNCN